jgi:hypothetical protein
MERDLIQPPLETKGQRRHPFRVSITDGLAAIRRGQLLTLDGFPSVTYEVKSQHVTFGLRYVAAGPLDCTQGSGPCVALFVWLCSGCGSVWGQLLKLDGILR